MIAEFKKEFSFLSNFYPSPIELDGLVYPTVEHAYQAAKTLNAIHRNQIRLIKLAGHAKRFGHNLQLRAGWNEMRLHVMQDLLRKKFRILSLRDRLLETGEEELREGNWWGDDFWGIPQGPLYRGVGQNHLGKLLMKVREELRGNDKNEKGILTDQVR